MARTCADSRKDDSMKLFWRIVIFFQLWGSDYYDEKIDAGLAWELAGIFAESDALDDFERMTA